LNSIELGEVFYILALESQFGAIVLHSTDLDFKLEPSLQ